MPMDVSKESMIFWSVIEKKSATRIQGHIKNILYSAGFQTAWTVKKITREKIEQIELFARGIPEIIDAYMYENGIFIDGNQKQHILELYFGQFASNPDTFHFNEAEIATLTNVVELTKALTLDENYLAFSRCQPVDAALSETPLGHLFPDHQEVQSDSPTHRSGEIEASHENENDIAYCSWMMDLIQIDKAMPETQNRQQNQESGRFVNENTRKAQFLKDMITCFRTNWNRLKQGFRYTDNIRLFCSYVRILSGKLAFETFKANTFVAVPSLRSIDRYIYKERSKIVEGELRSEQLREYLSSQGAIPMVHLSEDATAINGRVKLVRVEESYEVSGFALPLDNNGMPILHSYPARKASEIESFFYDIETKKEKHPANFANVVMAQPVQKEIPAFNVLVYCSDGKYNAKHVLNRWKYIINELKKHGIQVGSFGSDCDPRCNAAMKQVIKLGVSPPHFPSWFNASISGEAPLIPIQDLPHIGTKFRNYLVSHQMKFGAHVVSVKHLMKLIELVPKEKNKLSATIIKPTDRMNFETVLKVYNCETIDLLEKHVEGSEGTVMYLKVLDCILRCFLDLRLSPLERVRYIWFALFILRIWRKSVLDKRGSTLKKHFMTSYTYTCVEINAHSLVLFMMFLKKNNMDNVFSPEILGSQQCEAIFRQIRSFSSTFSTVTDASICDILQKMSKIQLLNDITHIKLRSYNFPRIGKPSRSYYPKVDRNGHDVEERIGMQLPTLPEIIEAIELAKLEAQDYAASLGVEVMGELACEIKLRQFNEIAIPNSSRITANADTDENADMLEMFSDINLSAYNQKIRLEDYDENGPYIKVQNTKNQVFYVKKPVLIWLLSKSTSKLSSDRLQRVMRK